MEVKRSVSKVLLYIEDVVYGIIAVLLIGTILLVTWAILQAFFHTFAGGELLTNIIHIIDNILLTLMVTEILYTVIVSFESHSLKAEPFLVVGLIATVRRILLISLQAAHVTEIEPEVFQSYMIELGILTVLIFVFVMSIYLLRKQRKPSTE
ncbi:MAG: phosphate-starvation-inducible PsiE family protein [Candidatus Zixiibacteriota bacterium]